MAIYNASGITLTQAYSADGSLLATAYDKAGNAIFNPEPYEPALTFLHSFNMSEFNPNKIISPQGMAVYGDYIAQYFTEDDSLRFIDMTDWSIDGTCEISEFLHGNGLQFGNTAQSSGFPKLYASQFGESASVNSQKIAIATVELSTHSIDGYYDIPAAAGYHPQFVADWTNGKAYTVGYPQLSTTSGNMIISAYNLSDMTTITEQWTVSYMGIVQGTCWWNGYVVVVGDTTNTSKVKVTFVNVTTHEKTEYQFDKVQNHAMEFQGVDVLNGDTDLLISCWIYDDNDSSRLKYWLYTINLPGTGQTIESGIG